MEHLVEALKQLDLKVELLMNHVRVLKRVVAEQKIYFTRGMKSVARAFEMNKECLNALGDNVEDFNQLTGLQGWG